MRYSDDTRYHVKMHTFLAIAKEVSKLSTCQFTQVGCVIVTPDFRPVSFGYNGTPSGHDHCDSVSMTRDEHIAYAADKEVHAEMNAILQADRNLLKGAIAFTTITPCQNCLKHMHAAGIKKVVCGSKYWRMSQEDFDLMAEMSAQNGVEIVLMPEK